MTQRLKGLVVALNDDIREDDAEAIISAIRMVKGVAKVAPVPTDVDDYLNRERVRLELEKKLWAALHEK